MGSKVHDINELVGKGRIGEGGCDDENEDACAGGSNVSCRLRIVELPWGCAKKL